MWTWATEIVNQIDSLGSWALAVLSALLNTTFWQIVVITLWIILLLFIIRVVYSLVQAWKAWR
jgi:hypothetical protein